MSSLSCRSASPPRCNGGRATFIKARRFTIYPAVVVSAFVGGYPAGLLSAVLAGLSQWYFFIPQYHWLAVLSYLVDAVVCVLLIEYVNRSLEKETEAKQRQTLLREELQHRIQNLFAVIQAIIRFSLPNNEARVSAAAIKDGLLDRLQALVDPTGRSATPRARSRSSTLSTVKCAFSPSATRCTASR